MAIEATPETFAGLVEKGNVLVDFWGPRCQPCLALMSAVEALEESYEGRLKLVKVNAPENREVCRDLKVLGLPAYLLYRAGAEVERYSTELHDPEITEPAGGGNVPDRNYRLLGGLAVLRGELEKAAIPSFAREHGLPGFSPTQGHIASAVPWLPHALERLASGEIRSTMLLAKGSLFLGRMTQLWDGASITLEG